MGAVLSTCWNAYRHSNGMEMIAEIKKLGFSEVELSFNLTHEIVRDIEKLVGQESIKVSSLHNFCPIPKDLQREIALPDYYAMSSLDEQERKLAIKYAKITIDTAQRVRARAVVLHCGRVQIPDKTRELIGLYENSQEGSPEFIALRQSIIQERGKLAKPFFENTLRSLEELTRYVQDRDVVLGVENRFYYREIPSDEEIGVILNKLKGGKIFYWHDCGHAQLIEKLGLAKKKAFLERYFADTIGAHLHNLNGCRDHQPLQNGEIDFNYILSFLNQEALKVIEVQRPASADQVRESRLLLEAVLSSKAQ